MSFQGENTIGPVNSFYVLLNDSKYNTFVYLANGKATSNLPDFSCGTTTVTFNTVNLLFKNEIG